MAEQWLNQHHRSFFINTSPRQGQLFSRILTLSKRKHTFEVKSVSTQNYSKLIHTMLPALPDYIQDY
ncbi:hypothetical protein ABHB20_09125, partial [Lacticaseibacillus paracasei]|uniref:hypothetical protein n=1 Tax=Lacticaseibacillus paracasei TaxID=1597 RepID=UPI00325B5EE8